MCVVGVLDTGIARVSLEYRSVMTNIYWLLWFVLDNGPSISIANTAREPNVERSCNVCLWKY